MPILWMYLLKNYFKVLFLSTFAFIAILLTMRLTEIANFATLGAKGWHIVYFAVCQIPYILPIALPIAALISAIILVQQLSKYGELTALRSAGCSLSAILTPLLLAASFLSLCNFYIVSELATNSHLSTALIKAELRSINPLLILGNKYLMKLKGIYCNTLGASKVGKTAADVVVAMPSQSNRDINLLIAKHLGVSSQRFKGHGLTLLSTLEGDTLWIENLGTTETSIKDFTQIVQKKTCTLNNDHLKMPLLISRWMEEKARLQQLIAAKRPLSEVKQKQRTLNRIYSEMMRRFSIALAVLTFTLLGGACGIQIGRKNSLKGLSVVIALTTLYVAAYFSGKGVDHLLIPSISFYLLPHLLLVAVSLWMLQRASRGVA